MFSKSQDMRDIINSKLHRSKGRTLFIVYVKPSKNKLDHVRILKNHLFIHELTGSISRSPLRNNFFCFDFEKQNSVLPYNILCTLVQSFIKQVILTDQEFAVLSVDMIFAFNNRKIGIDLIPLSIQENLY